MGYGYGRLQTPEVMELPPKEYPAQFPFRTDFGNDHLPWYSLKPGRVPPRFSEHVVFGELVKADAATRSARFLVDRTGETLDCTLIPGGSVRWLGADATLSEVTVGTRCRLHLYQDEHGVFSRASLISDEFSYLVHNAVIYRIESLNLSEGRLYVARQMPRVKNYNGDMEQPPDIARTELLVRSDTRVWKGKQPANRADLAVGEALLVNLTGEQPGRPSHCTDIWVGTETHKLVIDRQSKKNKASNR